MKKIFEINVAFHCCKEDSLPDRCAEITSVVGKSPETSELKDDTNMMVFQFKNKSQYEKAIDTLRSGIDDVDYSVNVATHILENNECVEHSDFSNNEPNVEDLYHLANMVSEILVRMTDNPHNAAFVLSFAAGQMVSDFGLDADHVSGAFDVGFDAGEAHKNVQAAPSVSDDSNEPNDSGNDSGSMN